MNYGLIIGGIILVICVVYYLVTYNNLVRLNNKVKESFATMDVYLKKRWDLIPNIVDKTVAAIVPTIAKINYLLKKFIFSSFR